MAMIERNTSVPTQQSAGFFERMWGPKRPVIAEEFIQKYLRMEAPTEQSIKQAVSKYVNDVSQTVPLATPTKKVAEAFEKAIQDIIACQRINQVKGKKESLEPTLRKQFHATLMQSQVDRLQEAFENWDILSPFKDPQKVIDEMRAAESTVRTLQGTSAPKALSPLQLLFAQSFDLKEDGKDPKAEAVLLPYVNQVYHDYLTLMGVGLGEKHLIDTGRPVRTPQEYTTSWKQWLFVLKTLDDKYAKYEREQKPVLITDEIHNSFGQTPYRRGSVAEREFVQTCLKGTTPITDIVSRYVDDVSKTIPCEAHPREIVTAFESAIQNVLRLPQMDDVRDGKPALEKALRQHFHKSLMTNQGELLRRAFGSWETPAQFKEPMAIIKQMNETREEIQALFGGYPEGMLVSRVLFLSAFLKQGESTASVETLLPHLNQAYDDYQAYKNYGSEQMTVGRPVRGSLADYEVCWKNWFFVICTLKSTEGRQEYTAMYEAAQKQPISILPETWKSNPYRYSVVVRPRQVIEEVQPSAYSSIKTEPVRQEASSVAPEQPSLYPSLVREPAPEQEVTAAPVAAIMHPQAMPRERIQLSYLDIALAGQNPEQADGAWFDRLPAGIQNRLLTQISLSKLDKTIASKSPWAAAAKRVYNERGQHQLKERLSYIRSNFVVPMEKSERDVNLILRIKAFAEHTETRFDDPADMQKQLNFWSKTINGDQIIQDRKLRQYVYEQALSEGASIDHTDNQWVERHYKDNLTTLAQACLRFYDQKVSDHAGLYA